MKQKKFIPAVLIEHTHMASPLLLQDLFQNMTIGSSVTKNSHVTGLITGDKHTTSLQVTEHMLKLAHHSRIHVHDPYLLPPEPRDKDCRDTTLLAGSA